MNAFAEHQRPDVFWLGDPTFDAAFRDLTGDKTMTEVGYTKPNETPYPGFINAQVSADGQYIVVTTRGDSGEPNTLGGQRTCAPTVQLKIPLDDWDQFDASVRQMRGGAERAQQQHIPGVDQGIAAEPFEGEVRADDADAARD